MPHRASPLRSLQPSLYGTVLLIFLLGVLAAGCANGRVSETRYGRPAPGYVKDNKPAIWISDHPRVAFFRDHYRRTTTVRTALDNGRPYLPTMLRVFRQKGLPEELAYLPMLESMFENRANSGHARGMWQFTRQTAEHVGLRVGAFADERLNWRKSTQAAADYLDELGEKFNYNWALALAAYNGGPNYIEQEMRRQRTGDFFQLRLRKETEEYVPRFIAMIQVARERFPEMIAAR
jgi:membrane-bound lytic murein transglycosylase D